jgi:hypothetical protein
VKKQVRGPAIRGSWAGQAHQLMPVWYMLVFHLCLLYEEKVIIREIV